MQTEDPSSDDLYRVGTLGSILQLLKLPDGTVKVLVGGGRRAQVIEINGSQIFYWDCSEYMKIKLQTQR